MHSFRPPAKVDVRDLTSQAYQLRRDAAILGTPDPKWRYDVSHGTYEQLLMARADRLPEGLHQPPLVVTADGGQARMALFEIPVSPSTEVPDDTIALTYGAIAKFEVTL